MKLLLSISLFSLLFLLPSRVFAIENPLEKPNNKQGIHILFPSELQEAASLVNTQGGDWGYVLIPIQSGDKDREKWQSFFDEAKKYHLIPIVRLATEGDYFNTAVWRKPTPADVMDFANFLTSLNWPTKNRYVIAFNEVNRGDEWGGEANPAEYAEILAYCVTLFKSKSEDFFIISSGMDNGAPQLAPSYIDQYNFFYQMNKSHPGIFNQIDGFASHSYPNPGFIQPPTLSTTKSIFSFKYELSYINQFTSKKLPVFITETGWDAQVLGDETAAGYYKKAYETVWNDGNIVAITPFLLRATAGPFQKFSFIGENNLPKLQHTVLKEIPKVAGEPTVMQHVLGSQSKTKPELIASFPQPKDKVKEASVASVLKTTVAWIFKL